MKRLKTTINSWLLSILSILTLGVGIFQVTKPSQTASYAMSEESTEIPWSYTDEDISYALYTQSTQIKNNVSTIVYRGYDYSNEYILLTSDITDASGLYNDSIYVRFNQQRSGEDKTSTRVPAAGLTVNAYLNDKQINVGKISSDPTNGYVNFAVSFRETTVITYADTLEPVDPADRSGLYQFQFFYRYTTPDGVTSEEIKELDISFHLIDKTDYLSDETAYTINGASQAPNFTDTKGIEHESYLYNYRYDVDGNIVYPTVSYEANKFALNYKHTMGSSVYNYKYLSFVPNYQTSEIEDDSFDATKPTGRIAIQKVGTSVVNYYSTYKNVSTVTIDGVDTEVVKPYYVTVDLTNLGEYEFSVDLIVPEELGATVTYQVAEIPDLSNSEVKYLVNYGYEITYKDQKSNTYKALRNNFTHADVSAKTPNTYQNTTSYSSHIPTTNSGEGDAELFIPVTDQAPIKFNYYSSKFDKTNSFYSTYTSKTEALAVLNRLSAMDYSDLLTDATLSTTFYETSKFDKKGIYIVKVCYTISPSYNAGASYGGIQLFCFEINNDAPALVVEYENTLENNTTVFEPLNTQYTNKSIRFKIQSEENSFNADINVRYTRYASFNNVATSSGTYISNLVDGYYQYTLSGSNYSIPNSLNGRYIIVVTYSPSKLNQYYEYIVDTSDIAEITFTKVTYEEPSLGGATEPYYSAQTGNTIAQTKTAEGNYDLALTNSYFTLSWKEKAWASYVPDGITTKVTAYQLLTKNTGSEAVYYSAYDKTLTNGYKTDIAAPLNYQNSYNSLFVNNLNGIKLSSNEYQTADGIYYFYVEDLAGNSFERLIMIDTSNPVFIQESQVDDGNGNLTYQNSYDLLANPANFVRTNTRLTFGKNKGIEYDYLTNAENEIFNQKLAGTSLLKEFDGQYFINIPINNVTVEKDNDGIRSTTVFTDPDVFAVIELTTSGSGQFAGEGQYYFTSYAKNGGSVYMGIEMNFDGAMGQYYMLGDDTGNNDLHYIANNNGSNLHKLVFKFKQGTEKTEVVRISYSYYKFDYFSNTSTYPFSTDAEKTGDLRIPDDDEADTSGFLTTDYINVDNGKTAPGKYVITRYYYGGGYTMVNGSVQKSDYGEYDASGNKVDFGQDSFTRKYTIYVDHNGVISTTEQSGMREVGDNISITIGKGTANEYTFKNFFRNVSAGLPILTTNKLPVQINVPVSKYFIDNGSANTNVLSRLYFATLDVVVTYKDTTKAYSPTVTYKIDSSTKEGYYEIPTFQAEGTYTITISDRTGYNEGSTRNINPMTYTCQFVIKHTYPTGDVYLNDDPLEPSELDDKTFATNADKEQSVTFRWQDAQDPYTASVVELNITTVGSEDKDTLLLSDYDMQAIINNTYEFDYSAFFYIKKFTVELISEDVFEGKIYYQYKYSIQLNIDEEFDYNVEIRYASASIANHGYGQYVSTSYRIKIDRTKPNLNIDNLLEKDTYLIQNNYYNNIEDLKENFKEENAVYSSTTPTIYDYAFAVDKNNFTLTYDGEDTISTFYFRSYAKYDSENQSITPDHKDYSNLSNFSGFPRFNITQSNSDYFLASYSTTPLANIIMSTSGISSDNLIGKFYEIIERDLAGNYRAFTIYFSPTESLYNILNIEATRDDDGSTAQVNTSNQETTTTKDLIIGKISSSLAWSKLVIKNLTDTTKTQLSYTLTPYLSTSTMYNMCNEVSNYMVTSKNCRYSFSITSPAGVSTKYFNVVKSETKLAMPNVISTDNNKYIMTFPKKTSDSVIYLTGLAVKKGNSTIINAQYPNIPTESEPLDGGLYIITYTDNTGSSYSYQLNLGIEYVSDDKQFAYATNSSYTDSDGVIYTGGNIFITFQSEAHSLIITVKDSSETDVDYITVNKESYNVDSSSYVRIDGVDYIAIGTSNSVYLRAVDTGSDDNGFRIVMLKEPVINDESSIDAIGGIKYYSVDYRYRGGEDNLSNSVIKDSIIIYDFVIFNQLAGISLFDKNQNPIVGSTSSSSMALTSSSVKITWDDLLTAPLPNLYSATVILNSLTESGQIISSIEINKNRIISTPGYYAVTLCNTAFGNFRSVYFAIQDGEVPFYTVVDSKTGATLTASPDTLDIVNNVTVDSGISLKTAIQNHIDSLSIDDDLKRTLGNKLSASPTNVEQYFSLNDCDLRLDASSELHSEKIYFKNGCYVKDILNGVGKQDYLTTFYLIYGDNNPIYANLIAITRVPKSETNIVANKLFYVYKTNTEVSNELTGIAKTIKNTELDSNSVHIYWSKVSKDDNSWYNRGNLVYLNYTFNNVTSVRNFGSVGTSNTITAEGGLSTITISGSGKHQLAFMDLAGNVSYFKASNTGYSQSYYQITILDKVIYTVNGTTPLDYAVFNSAITLSVDTSYSSDYDVNSLTITVMRNGSYYENYISNTEGTSFTFSESGRYIITLNANYQDTVPLNSAVYNFTIIDKTSARLAYEFNEMLGYTITKVYKNNSDITDRIKAYYIAQKGLNVSVDDYTLSELFISPEKFGNGDYIVNVAVKYNSLLAAKEFSFGFRINNVVPVIMSSPDYGETTKKQIVLTFNPSYIYQQIGKSAIVVYTFNADTNRFNEIGRYSIDESSMADTNIKTYTISETNSYYFQLVTDSGNIITSFRINRAEPLNTLSIIIIVLASATVVVLTIVFIKMRTKMKVR